jgi:hypothetical protein
MRNPQTNGRNGDAWRRFLAAMLLLPLLGSYSGAVREWHHESEVCEDGCSQLADSHVPQEPNHHSHKHCDRCVFCHTLTFTASASFESNYDDLITLLPVGESGITPQCTHAACNYISAVRPRAPPCL